MTYPLSDSKRYWIGFNLVKGIGAARLRILLEHFGDIESAWNASSADLRAAGLQDRLVQNLVKVRQEVSLDLILEQVTASHIQVLTWEDETYPRRLKEIEQPPPVLYLRGELLLEDEWAVAVVGTRRMTRYGRQVADETAAGLARNGITVVSGLARGIDGVAHQAAINAEGRTLAVLGSGVDYIYPAEHRRLAENIMEHGALISDYPPGTPPEASNFPPRNRIVSGLSQAVIVIEAGERSGALITAAFAAEQGREVFAVPGSIFSRQSLGPNQLIQQGARPFLQVQDVLDTLNLSSVPEYKTARAVLPADAVEAQLFALLGREPLHIDDLRARCGMPIDQVSAALTMMELKGLVRQVGAMQYVAVSEQQADYQIHEGGQDEDV